MTTATSGSSNTSAFQCHWCERISDKKLRKCGTCFSARYCDLRCQIAHWPEHKKVCPSPNTSTTDVTKSVANKTLRDHGQAEQTTDSFNHLNTNLTVPPPPSGAVKTKPSLPASFDPLALETATWEDLETFRKESTHLSKALFLLRDGDFSGACHYILKNTSEPLSRIEFIQKFARHMCAQDEKNITLVMKLAPLFVENAWRKFVIDILIEYKIFTSPEEIEKALEQKLVCHSPDTLTTDLTKSVVNTTPLNYPQAEQTTGPFNHLNNTLTVPPPPRPVAKKEPSLPTYLYLELLGQEIKAASLLWGGPASLKKECAHLQEAFRLLKLGDVSGACNYIAKNTAQYQIRIGFMKELATHMCTLDKKNITLVMEKANHIICFAGRLAVMDGLIEAKIFLSRQEIEKAESMPASFDISAKGKISVSPELVQSKLSIQEYGHPDRVLKFLSEGDFQAAQGETPVSPELVQIKLSIQEFGHLERAIKFLSHGDFQAAIGEIPVSPELVPSKLSIQECGHLERALKFLSQGNIPDACSCILNNSVLPPIRSQFLVSFAKVMCARDKKHLTVVMRIAPFFVKDGWRETVIAALCKAKIFASREEIEKALEPSSS